MTVDAKKRWFAVMIGATALLGFLLRGWLRPEAPKDPLRIAVVMGPQSGLVFLAEKMGYFQDAGVRVVIQSYPDSMGSAEALEDRRADLAAVSDSFVAEAFVRGEPIVVLSQLHNAQRQSSIVVRRASGIHRLADLKGRRLAVSKDAELQYFLARSFVANDMRPEEVDVDVLPSEEAVEAFRTGKVNALAVRRSGLLALEDGIGANTLRVIDTSSQMDASLLGAFSATVKDRRPEIEAVLRALAMAYDFYLERRDDAYLSLLDVMGQRFSPSQMMQIWAFMSLDLSLSNVLLMNLREQQTWFEQRLGVTEEADIESSFANGLLRRVRPDLVTIM